MGLRLGTFTGLAMTLANMRVIGVRSIEATCECGRQAIVGEDGGQTAWSISASKLRK